VIVITSPAAALAASFENCAFICVTLTVSAMRRVSPSEAGDATAEVGVGASRAGSGSVSRCEITDETS
jgi:hypothetical protein